MLSLKKAFSSTLLLVATLAIANSSLFAAELFRKQTGTATIATTTNSVTVTIPAVCMTQSFLVFTVSTNTNNPGDFHVGGEITNSTTLTFTRLGNTSTPVATIKWQVFEFEGNVSVQRGVTIVNTPPVNIAISAVNLSKTFVIASMSNNGATAGDNDGFTADLTSTTNLRLSATAGNTPDFKVYWQVIEYQDATVKKFNTTLAAGTASTTTTISPAITTLSKAFVISNHTISANVDTDDLPRTELTNTTTVTYTRGVGTTAAMNFVTYVVEFTDLTTVVRGTQAFASGSVLQNVAVTAAASTGLFGPGNQGRQGSTSYATDDNFGHAWFNYELTSLTNLAITRAVGTGSTANAPYQLVTFEDQNTSPRTYYSLATGAWESNTSWSLSSDGSSGAVGVGVYPRRSDNVVIRTGHNITINSVTDNGLCGLSPDALSRTNVGPFAASNLTMFYQTGDILINGTLTVTGIEMMVEGYTKIASGGVFSLTSSFVNLGFLEADAGSTLSAADDIILAGNSATIINTTSISNDDLIISFPNATLCGTGTTTLQNGSGSVVTYANGATVTQICNTFTVACTGVGCSGFPVVGTGPSSIGNSGPGGVASTNGASELKVWLDASASVFSNAGTTPSVDGGVVQQWNDRSGSTNHATKTTSNQPTYDAVDPAINNAAAIDFSSAGSNRFNLNTFTLNPFSSSFSIISVFNSGPTTGANQNIIQQKDASGTGRTMLLYDNALGKLTSFLGNTTTAPAATYTLSTWTISSQTFSLSGATTTINLFKAGTADGSGSVTPETTTGAWVIGSNKAESGNFFNGSMGELLILNQSLNNAKRIIVENYLSAKYDIALTANDVYTMDNVGNGNFDFEVAGVGQASDGSKHIDAKGPGMVRMWNPNGLANSEFLMWGHDNGALSGTTSGVDGSVVAERLSRIWRVGESADVGTVSISFDLSSLASPLGSNLRLLIDRDGDGFADNDVTPVAGSFINNTVVFSGIDFQTGDRFTLGNTNASIPLPIELISFSAKLQNRSILLSWSTASEHNNDFFTIERTQDAKEWISIGTVKGVGNSTVKKNYHFTDDKPYAGVSYYRLKQTDMDKKFTYSKVVRTEVEEANQILVYPNPSTRTFTLTSPLEIKQIKFLSTLGSMLPISIEVQDTETVIYPGDISPGIYFIQVLTSEGIKSIRVIRK